MSAHTTPQAAGSSLDQLTATLTIEEVGRMCAVRTDYIALLVREGVIAPALGSAPESWRFTSLELRHTRVASRLQRDLGVNLAGAALALQLLDELEFLRAQIAAATGGGAVDAG
jgi:chaperone modulatory protein CbpM